MGDDRRDGWVAHAMRTFPYTTGCYNLSIRGQTVFQVAERAASECRARLIENGENRIVIGAMLNELARYAYQDNHERFDRNSIAAAYSALITLLSELAPVLIIGPTPILPERMPFFSQLNQTWFTFENEDIAWLDRTLGDICSSTKSVYIPVFNSLLAGGEYMQGLAALDGLHSNYRGYTELWRLISGHESWRKFISTD